MKKCFKCGVVKELGHFYRHAQMGDGHLNKCISCTKSDARIREATKRSDPVWVESERTRGRHKYRRLYTGVKKDHSKYRRVWIEKFPEKRAAHMKTANLKPPFGKAHAHHWSYKEEHQKDVIWLSKDHHAKAHRFIKYDQSEKLYRRRDNNELLDTKTGHGAFIKNCIENEAD